MRCSRRDRCGSGEKDRRVNCWSIRKNGLLFFFILTTFETDAILLFLDDTVEHLQHLVLFRAEPVHLFLSPSLLLLLLPHYCIIEGRFRRQSWRWRTNGARGRRAGGLMSIGVFLRLNRISSQRFFNRPTDGAAIALLSRTLTLLLSLGWRTASRNTVKQ